MFIRRLYNLCFPFAFFLLLPGYLRRMVRRGNYRRNFWQRFGYFSDEVRARLAEGPERPWLQAVSVGEMLVALKLIAALRAREPGFPLVLSTTTTTAFQLAAERAPVGVEVMYTPIDLLGAVRRTFRVVRPGQLVIVDGGLWPNQLWEAKRRGIPAKLVNARLSPRSERRFRRFRSLAAAMFRLLDVVAVPEQTDLNRWHDLGVPRQNLRWTGSIKFDDASPDRTHAAGSPLVTTIRLRELLSTIGVAPGVPILLAGSTHPGEEKIVGEVFVKLRARFPDLFFVTVPRHAERAPDARADLEGLGLRVLNRTALSCGRETTTAKGEKACDTLLVDTTGELQSWYTVAALVVIGKSFTAVGGQNPAEAVAAGKPVLFGPHMENFADLVSALLSTGGATQVGDANALEAECARLLADPSAVEEMVAAARRQLDSHRGAAARTAELLLNEA